jgi:hypothetical protein
MKAAHKDYFEELTMNHATEVAERTGVPVDFARMNLGFMTHGVKGTLTREMWEKCERIRIALEGDNSRGPVAGDVVVAVGPEKIYRHAHLEGDKWAGNDWTICTHPMTPHVSPDLHVSASGGYWFAAQASHLGATEDREEKTFWTWGDLPCANGGIYFTAKMKVWGIQSTKIY